MGCTASVEAAKPRFRDVCDGRNLLAALRIVSSWSATWKLAPPAEALCAANRSCCEILFAPANGGNIALAYGAGHTDLRANAR